jgi:hypothetical protein
MTPYRVAVSVQPVSYQHFSLKNDSSLHLPFFATLR